MEFQNWIEIKNLFFRFPNEKVDMLKDISMTIQRGKKLGLLVFEDQGKQH